MEKFQIKAQARAKGKVNKLRKSGQIPAVLYGHNVATVSLNLSQAEFERVFKKTGESTIIDLVTEDGKTHPVLIHDVKNHILTNIPIHVDFYEVSMTEKLKAKVAIEYTGESKAVKELGGVLVKVLNEVEVECLPADLPHNIPVSIAVLNTFQDAVYVKDLKVSDKVHIVTPGEEVVIKVQPPRDVEAELAKTVDETAAVASTVEASTEKKEEAAEEPAVEPKEAKAK